MSGIKLISTGSALPAQEVTNFDLEKKGRYQRRVDRHPHRHQEPPLLRRGREPSGACAWRRPGRRWSARGIEPGQIGVCLVATLTQDTMTPLGRLRPAKGAGPGRGHRLL